MEIEFGAGRKQEVTMSQLALLGGPKTKRKPFPEWPLYDERERAALMKVLESRVWWRTPGTRTLEFERNFARFHGAKHGVAVTNGTAALEVTMAPWGWARGMRSSCPTSPS